MTFYKMINISNKFISYRRACVVGSIYVGRNVFYKIKNKEIEKGDPLILAEIAGINAAKNTSSIILLCHQINIENIFFNVIMDEDKYSINIYCIVFSHSKTGVEMEAMCGVFVGLLTIYDLTKKLNPFILIKDIKLLFKDGGENGLVLGSINDIPYNLRKHFFNKTFVFGHISVIILTVSDRASHGCYKDISGQFLFDFFRLKHSNILKKIIIPDDINILSNILTSCIYKDSPNFIITTGGTGISKRDITVDVLFKLCRKIIPGISELLRFSGSRFSYKSWLSNTISGICKNTLIVALPGNASSIYEGLNIIENILSHAFKILKKYD